MFLVLCRLLDQCKKLLTLTALIHNYCTNSVIEIRTVENMPSWFTITYIIIFFVAKYTLFSVTDNLKLFGVKFGNREGICLFTSIEIVILKYWFSRSTCRNFRSLYKTKISCQMTIYICSFYHCITGCSPLRSRRSRTEHFLYQRETLFGSTWVHLNSDSVFPIYYNTQPRQWYKCFKRRWHKKCRK